MGAKWQRKPRVPKVTRPWVFDDVRKTDEVVKLYRDGYGGTVYDPEARDELLDAQAYPDGEDVASAYFAGSGVGKLSLPFLPVQQHYEVWPKPGQETGDCVSRAGANAGLVLIGTEVASGEPDPTSGLLEGYPVVSEVARRNGVLASEALYGDRGHPGQGASCYKLIKHATKLGGMILRKNYTPAELGGDYEDKNQGIDLEKLNTKLGIGWGRSQTPQELRNIGKRHQIRLATDVDNHEVARDFINNGYPLWVCSGLGWENKRDANGYSRRSRGWAHSWIVAGYDDRQSTHELYGNALALFVHDWWKWNKGGRRIRGTQIDIPHGCFWFDAPLLDQCDVTAVSNLSGWKRRRLPDLSPGFL